MWSYNQGRGATLRKEIGTEEKWMGSKEQVLDGWSPLMLTVEGRRDRANEEVVEGRTKESEPGCSTQDMCDGVYTGVREGIQV